MTAQSVNRKLTAIFSADVKGYSRLMGDDEVATVRTLTRYREMMTAQVRAHRGRVVDSPGDNMLAEFGSVVEAVRCGVAIQERLRGENRRLPARRKMEYRIGINLGDVIEDGDRIYGDGINIAARIESLADGGGICVSRTVYDQVKKKLPLGYEYMGAFEVKNISEPVRVYRIKAGSMKAVAAVTPAGTAPKAAETTLRGGSAAIPVQAAEVPATVFHLEFQSEGDRIRVRSFEGSPAEQRTLQQYEESHISFEKAEEYSRRIKDLLGKANRSGRVGHDIVNTLRQTGHLLYDELIPGQARENLNGTKATTLVLSIDDRLVHIPWELLSDGKEFLCRRFAMGRVVSTRQPFSAEQRTVGTPVSMLLLTDPQGNLPDSYNEGIKLRDLLDRSEGRVSVSLKSSNVTTDYVKGKLRYFDILHYAGHADHKPENPSESGFLLSDGKLRAEDVRNMVGRQPFPAFVFSNACQSGQTDEWKVGEGYDKIYGLANAFLLSGVRHYLGTFWEVQDEPSLHYALALYEELMQGAMIGEAVRKARTALVEKYGEDTVIWASYMLYGDPTVRYVDTAAREKAAEPVEEKETVLAGSFRTGEAVVQFPGTSKKNTVIAAAVLALLLAVGALVVSLRKGGGDTTPASPAVATTPVPVETAAEKAERVDALVSELAERYRLGEVASPKEVDGWTTRPMTVVFLDIRGEGISKLDRDFVLAGATRALLASGRAKVVEREVLDKLLQELNLSASALADPSVALRIGRVLSARVMITGSILREGKDWMTNLRMIETETTAITGVVASMLSTEERKVVAEDLGARLLANLSKESPVRGRITTADGDEVRINVGSEAGLTKGVRLEVLSDTTEIIGELETFDVGRGEAFVKVVTGQPELKEGMRVREIL